MILRQLSCKTSWFGFHRNTRQEDKQGNIFSEGRGFKSDRTQNMFSFILCDFTSFPELTLSKNLAPGRPMLIC